SEIVPPQGEGHAAWTATASHPLAAFDRNYRALVIGDRLITCQQLHSRDEPKAGGGQLVERGVVAVLAQDTAWAHREAIAGPSPPSIVYRSLLSSELSYKVAAFSHTPAYRNSSLISSSSVQRTPCRIEPIMACSPITMPTSRVKNRLGSGGRAYATSLRARAM